MLCSSSAGSTHDILNVTIKEACNISVFPLVYRCADDSLTPSSKSCNGIFSVEKKTSNTLTSYHHVFIWHWIQSRFTAASYFFLPLLVWHNGPDLLTLYASICILSRFEILSFNFCLPKISVDRTLYVLKKAQNLIAYNLLDLWYGICTIIINATKKHVFGMKYTLPC